MACKVLFFNPDATLILRAVGSFDIVYGWKPAFPRQLARTVARHSNPRSNKSCSFKPR